MLAAVFRGKGKLVLEDVPARKPGPYEIMIRVSACGVCGTDMHIYHGDEGTAPTPPGTILGHEFSGIVCEVGENIRSLRVGDKVSVDPNDYCGSCYYCRNGKAHFCENMTGIGTTVNGGFAEYCTLQAKQAYKLKDEMPLEWGALAEPVACCLHGIDLSRISPGDTVLIIGAGTIGLMMMQMAKSAGASRVVVVEPVEEKRKSAYALGAALCIDPATEDPAVCMHAAGIPPVDVSIECVGLSKTVLEAIRLCGRGGTVMMFGLTPPDTEIALKPFEIFKKELHLTSSFINPYTLQRSLNLIESDTIKLDPLLGARVPLKDIDSVFTDDSYRNMGKVLIVP